MKNLLWAAALSSLVLAACSKPEPAPEPVRSVKVLTVGTDAFGAEHEYAAEVRPRIESRLGFRVAGKITRREVEVGQHVQAGQVLAQLDPKDYRLADHAARSQVVAAQTNRDLAASDLKRYRELREQNFISGAELERREATLKAAQAQLEQAQSQQAAQGNQAGYTQLVADVSGIITAIEAEPGQVVAAGTPVVRIAPDGTRDVVFSVPEDRVSGIRPGSSVEVRVWANQSRLSGKVREVAASADPQTRTFLVKVALDATQAPPLGSTVYAVPKGQQGVGQPVIKLPTSALKQDGQASAVWLLDTGSMTVRSRPVQIATADGNQAVIAAGLKPGDVVVYTGVHVLSPGQKVTVYQDRASNAPNAANTPVAPQTPANALPSAPQTDAK